MSIYMMQKELTFGLIVGSRGFFNPKLSSEGRSTLIKTLEEAGYGYRILPVDATPNGVVETYTDAKKYAEYFRSQYADIDGLIVSLPNFGDEQGIVETISRASLEVPVLIQACDDDLDKLSVELRRDAFCGKLSVCANLYQYDIPFTLTTNHTCALDSEVFKKDVDFFARVCRVVRGLTNARIGQIGTRPAPFQTVRYSEKLLQETGITVVPIDLSDMMARANALDDGAAAVKKKLDEIHGYGTVPERIETANVLRQAKLSVAIESWLLENECQASAIQCWDSIQNNYGCATCLTMSMMGENYMPSACETDIAGVVSMYALDLATDNPAGFMDWNNNFGSDLDKVINTHCSNYPKSFVGKDIEISELDILGESLGRERCFGAIKGHLVPGPMTYFRLSTFDTEGRIGAYLGEGQFTDDKAEIDGGSAVCHIDRLQDLMKYICKNGFEHHVAISRGHYAAVLKEAIDTYLGWDLYVHE